MNARQELVERICDPGSDSLNIDDLNAWVQARLDAYRREVLAEAAEQLYGAADNGDCGCGCWCARIIDPDVPCPRCEGLGEGHGCCLCGLVREDAAPAQAAPAGWTPIRGIPVPAELLVDGQWTPGVIAWLAGELAKPPQPTFTGVLEYLADGVQ